MQSPGTAEILGAWKISGDGQGKGAAAAWQGARNEARPAARPGGGTRAPGGETRGHGAETGGYGGETGGYGDETRRCGGETWR